MKIGKMELYRLFWVNKLILLVVGCLILKVVLLFMVPEIKDPRIKLSQKQYDYYLEMLYGDDSVEKQQFIESEYKKNKELSEQYAENYEAYTTGEMSEEKWTAYLEEYELAKIRFSAISIFYEKLGDFQQVFPVQDVDPPEYFYDYGWKTYFNYLSFPDVLALISTVLLAVLIFGADISTGAVNLLRTTRYGKQRLFLCRTVLCIISSLVVAALHAVLEYAVLSSRLSLNDAAAPIYSLPNFAGVPFPGSIQQSLILCYVFRIVGLCLIGLFVLFLSVLLKNMVGTLCFTIAAVVLPLLLNTLPGGYISYTYTGFLNGGDVIKNYVNFPNVLFWLLPLMFLLMVSTLLFYMSKRRYEKGQFPDG